MGFRLLAIDLDDTLLDSRCCISPRAKNAIKEARAKGVFVTLATGRMFRSALPYARELQIDVPLITYQGALVMTSVTKEMLYHRSIPLALARQVVQEGIKEKLSINVYIDDTLYVARITPEIKAYTEIANVPAVEVGSLAAFLNRDPTKILLLGDERRLQEIWDSSAHRFGDALYITKSKGNYLEFTHPLATKGEGLKAVARHLHIKKEEILVFGDSYNDLELFKYAGYAVAMGNARNEIKQRADYVTKANNEDGVAEAIEKLVLAEPRDSGAFQEKAN